VYAFSFVRPPPPNTPHASRPYADRAPDSPAAIRSSASSQVAGVSVPSAERTSGEVSRTEDESTAGAVRPLPHSAPRFTGKSARSLTSTPPVGAGVRFIPHCRAQYGQWVGVEVVSMLPSVRRACYVP
jgi:hypothetical protein